MSKIKILHCPIGSMNIGGIENMIMQMYRTIDRDRFSFDFVVHDGEKNFYEDEIISLGGILHRVDFISKNPLRHIIDFFKLLKNNPDYKVIHIHTTYSIMFMDALLSKLLGRTVIIHSHNSSAPAKRSVVHKLFKQLQDLFCDYRFTCSDFAAQWMFPKRSQKSAIFWPNAMDLEHLKFSQVARRSVREELEANGKFIIGNVGRLSYQKNQTRLLEIYAEYSKINADSELWLVGDGPDRENLEEYSRMLNISSKVRFLGAKKNVSDYLSAMDLFILTSRYEGLPLSLIETQTSGLMTLAVRSGITEQVKCNSALKYVDDISEKKWAVLINRQREKNLDRFGMFEEMLNSNFNIYRWISKVEDIYECIARGEILNDK
ncbi:glycosyltransferase [Streptococcus sp. E29BA]|uniref:glycosyltransferase n=1 Tax=Streptococcus sp. E29BA TaxID=3278716 RepID=UPI00359D1EC4